MEQDGLSYMLATGWKEFSSSGSQTVHQASMTNSQREAVVGCTRWTILALLGATILDYVRSYVMQDGKLRRAGKKRPLRK